MVEIECPNCQARYQVPEQALGPNGRDVTCSSCGNVWHAVPVPSAPPPIEATAIGVQTRAPQRPELAGGQRGEIRQMLDEVQQAETRRAVPPAPDEPGRHVTENWGVTADPIQPPGGGRRDVHEAVFGHARGGARDEPAGADEDDEDLRTRLGMAQGQSGRLKSVRRGEAVPDGQAQRGRMMQKHRRRHRKFVEEKRRGTGAGATGFTFVVLVAGTIAGLYQLADPIAAARPQSAEPMRDYVVAIDSMRSGLETSLGGLTGAIRERIEGDGEEDEAGATEG